MLCRCNSKKPARPLHDARGIFCTYVCDECESKARKKYRTEIFTNPNYYADEQIEAD